MKCTNCVEEMVAAIGANLPMNIVPEEKAVPWYVPAITGPKPTYIKRLLVCPRCGLSQFFVDDPAAFRSPGGTETLPRPAADLGGETTTLPRAVDSGEP